MAFKFIAVFALVAAASAGIIPVQQHAHVQYQPATGYQHPTPAQHVIVSQNAHAAHHEEYPNDPHPKYNFSYDVKDAVSGDSKSQVEERDGDVVRGEYSLIDADGFKRTVTYTADDVNGFNAVVHREPISGHHVVESTAHAAPAYQVHSAPVAQYHHSSAPAVVKTQTSYLAPSAIVKSAPVAYVAPSVQKNTQVTYTHQQQAYETPVNHHAHPEQLQEQHQQQHQQQQQQQYQQQQEQHHDYATYEAPQQESHEGYEYHQRS